MKIAIVTIIIFLLSTTITSIYFAKKYKALTEEWAGLAYKTMDSAHKAVSLSESYENKWKQCLKVSKK